MGYPNRNPAPALFFGGCIILGTAIIFASLYLGKVWKDTHRDELAMNSGQQENADTPDPFETKVEDQFLAAMERQTKDIEFIEVDNIRLTENKQTLAIDFKYKLKPTDPEQIWHDLELRQDEAGRYVGEFTLGGVKFNVTIY